MKKKILFVIFTTMLLSLLFVSCKKKTEEVRQAPTKDVETTVKMKQHTFGQEVKIDNKLQDPEVLKKLIKRKSVEVKSMQFEEKKEEKEVKEEKEENREE